MIGTLFLQYAERNAAAFVLTALRRCPSGLVCELVGDRMTSECVFRTCERLYRQCYNAFGPPLWITASSISFGQRPLHSTRPGPAFAHDSVTLAKAKMGGFAVELLKTAKDCAEARGELGEWELPYELAGFEGVLCGEFENLGTAELLGITAAGLLPLGTLRIEVLSQRSLRLAEEEIQETAQVLVPSLPLSISRGSGPSAGLSLLSPAREVRLSLPSQSFSSALLARSGGHLPALQTYWNATAAALQVAGDTSQYWFEKLCRLYSDHLRSYHTLTHIYEMLQRKEDWGVHSPALDLAVWFHDAIYLPREKDNEERSAQLFSRFAAEASVAIDVQGWILATKSHSPVDATAGELILLDLDLAILSAEADRYQQYARQIYEEYSWVGESLYRTKRCEVLRGFLAQARLYHSAYASAAMEHSAQRNIQWEIQRLESDETPLSDL